AAAAAAARRRPRRRRRVAPERARRARLRGGRRGRRLRREHRAGGARVPGRPPADPGRRGGSAHEDVAVSRARPLRRARGGRARGERRRRVSTILKALRRLEQERTKSAARPLREQVTLSQARPRGPWRAWLAVAAALLLGFTATWAVLATFERPGAHHASVSMAPPPEASRSASDVAAAGSAAAPPAVAAPPPTVRVAAGAPAAGAVA